MSTTLVNNFKEAYSIKSDMNMLLIRQTFKSNPKVVKTWNPHGVIELNRKVLFFDVIHRYGEYKFALSKSIVGNYDIRLYTKHFTPKFKVENVELQDLVQIIDLIFKQKIKKFGTN